MAKTLRVPPAASLGFSKKLDADKTRAKGITGCTLLELCNEDKAKVAKLLRQVVDLEKELTRCKTQASKASNELQEKNQHLRRRSVDAAQENSTLRAKLTHAFALLRAYQHKIRILDAASPATPDPLQPAAQAPAAANGNCQQVSCQQCGHASMAPHDVMSDARLQSGQAHQHCMPLGKLLGGARDGDAHAARQDQSLDQPVDNVWARFPEREPVQQSKEPCRLPPDQTAPGQLTGDTRQQPFADLAVGMLACEHDSSVSHMSQLTAEEVARSVLRFDPSLGTDGAFYFASPAAAQLRNAALTEGPRADATAAAAAAGPHSHVHEACSSAPGCTAQPVMQQGSAAEHSKVACSTVGPPNTAAANASGKAEAACSGEQQALQEGGSEQTGTVQGQPLFPLQGGGQAGVLLRAAAAAAAGCSHELVLAAAGCASEDTAERPTRPPSAAADASHADDSTSAPAFAHAQQGQQPVAQVVEPETAELTSTAMDESQPLAELDDDAQKQETFPDPDSDRDDEGLHTLGFDSSLMDLVTEVEQMVACKQARGEQASRQTSPMLGTRTQLAQRVVSLQRSAGCKQPAAPQAVVYDEDFEENDVISLISDQEYSLH